MLKTGEFYYRLAFLKVRKKLVKDYQRKKEVSNLSTQGPII